MRNDKVDRAVSKIDFLTRNGLDKDMARKLARLLDDEELKHPRTVEQQKKAERGAKQIGAEPFVKKRKACGAILKSF